MNLEEFKKTLNNLNKLKKYDEALLFLSSEFDVNLVTLDRIKFSKALIYFKKDDLEKAYAYLLDISNEYRKDNKYFYLSGQIHEKLEKFDLAEKSYFVAVRKQPMNRNYIAKYLDFMDKFSNKFKAFEKIEKIIINRDDKNHFLQFEKAKFLKENNKNQDAIDIFSKILLNNINNDEINKELTFCFLAENQNSKAESSLNNIKSVDNIEDFLILNDILRGVDSKDFIDKVYNFKYKKIEKSKSLNIVFSPEIDKFILQGYSFNNSTLFVSERFYSYYTYGADKLSEYLLNFAIEEKYTTINLTGSSKGSFAAINIGVLMSKNLQAVKNLLKINVVAFSPQTQLYPLNENIHKLASYKQFLKRTTQNKLCKKYFERYGGIADDLIHENIKIKIVYGENHKRDRIEAERLKNFNKFELLPIAQYPLHTTIVLFVRKGQKLIDSLTRKVKKISKDDAFFMNEQHDEQVKEILNRLDQYNYDLNDLFEEF